MITVTPQVILALNPHHPNATIAAEKITNVAAKWGMTTKPILGMFLGQMAHESNLVPIEENLNYRVATLMRVWPSRFPTVAAAQPYAFNPQALANKVYGGRMGNTAPGDGWLYHGRGPIQLTGKDNYGIYQTATGFPLLSQPALLLQYGVGFDVAGAFWQRHGLNAAAARGDVVAVTRAINGGLIGLDDREALYQRALNRLGNTMALMADNTVDTFADDAQADNDARNEAVNQAASALANA